MRLLCAALALLSATAMPARALDRAKSGAITHDRSVTLRGKWQVGPVINSSHHALPIDLAAQLASARLPRPGEVVRAAAGKLYVGSVPCDEVFWTETSFAASECGDGLTQALGLSRQARVYQADTAIA